MSNWPHLNLVAGRHHYSLVGSGIHTFLPGEAVHATDDPGVHLCPALVTDLSPLASVFHLQKAVSDGNPFPVRVSGPDPHILHLHRQTLRDTEQERFHHLHSTQQTVYTESLTSESRT